MNLEILPDEQDMRRVELAYERDEEGQRRYPGLLIPTHAMTTAKSWLKSRAWGLFMFRHETHAAGTGRGKSLVLALLHRLLRERIWREREGWAHPGRVLYIRCSDLNDLGGYEKADLKEVTQQMKRAGALLIDELGAEDDTVLPFVRSTLEHRGSGKRWTAGGGNILPPEAVDRYGGRWVSRMLEGGKDEKGRPKWIVAVEGDDLRGDPRVPPLPKTEPTGPYVPIERWEELLADAARRATEGSE